jgi:hypothetical protein
MESVLQPVSSASQTSAKVEAIDPEAGSATADLYCEWRDRDDRESRHWMSVNPFPLRTIAMAVVFLAVAGFTFAVVHGAMQEVAGSLFHLAGF